MTDAPPPSDRHARARQLMVEQQIRRRGVRDQRVLDAMATVPRHLFVDPSDRDHAYEDHPLLIGGGQTISQPYMVARMTELSAPGPRDRVLEVGAGSGYQTAVLAALCDHVYAAEIIESLARRARRALDRTGVTNATVECRDGSMGWPEHAPFDAILVAAGAPAVPHALTDQLADGGRLVVPVGGRGLQTLEVITRRGDELERRPDTMCRFVNLRGKGGWDGPDGR